MCYLIRPPAHQSESRLQGIDPSWPRINAILILTGTAKIVRDKAQVTPTNLALYVSKWENQLSH